jgi:hypothetical protein
MQALRKAPRLETTPVFLRMACFIVDLSLTGG